MNAQSPENTQALPQGTRLEEFEIQRVLGSGGFGITYLASDTSLGRQVVIKENLPVQFAWRDSHSLTVSPRHTVGEDAENFAWSLENFAKEAAMLASLDHPAIVKVLRSFRFYGTAFFVMPFVDGMPLDELARSRAQTQPPFEENELIGLLEHLLAALAYLHERGIYHRDIKPANILITRWGMPVLIDFGSARQRLSERSMTVIESPGYTPFEQLQSRGNVGPWSDLYAMAGTVARILTGKTPPKAADRAFDDPWVPLAQRPEIVSTYSGLLLTTVDRAFASRPADRWQDAGQWLGALAPRPGSSSQATNPPAIRPRRTMEDNSLVPGTERDFQIAENAKMRFCWIPPGEFMMGSPDDEIGRSEDETLHPVRISQGFWLAKYPCTQSEWFAVMGNRPSYFGKPGLLKQIFDPRADASTAWHHLPVESVSWFDICGDENRSGGFLGQIKAYAPDGWRFDLPTEAQWERACRGGTTTATAFGNRLSSRQANFNGNHPHGGTARGPYLQKTASVKNYQPNAYGLYDMHGNVWEWCVDAYQKALPDGEDPLVSTGTHRVIRGGGWYASSRYCRSACRDRIKPDFQLQDSGFRLAAVPSR